MAGSVNNWNPGSAAHALTHDATDRSYQITLPATVAGEAQLEISDVAGRAVLRTRVRNGQTVDVSRLPAGLYLSRLSAGGAVGVSKFSKE